MSTKKESVQYILEKLQQPEIFSVRAMFGEYALYAHGVVVALICNDQLYIKDLPASRELSEYCDMDTPYEGAKSHYVVEEYMYDTIPHLVQILVSISESRSTQEPKKKKEKIEKKKEKTSKTTFTKKTPFMQMTFSERVVELALTIPFGKVTTYGAIARAAGGGAMSSQSITSILGKAYMAGEKNIPFHRIVYSDGRIWTSAEIDTKRRALYKKEAIEIDQKNKIINFKEKLFEF
ncbi:MAG: hypothetical protein RI996_39 [Candidatus Parcubacteria bacterium]|jgi:alkylated DNA nucleotide flippase Atl1/TfoX/Sxy family transcriptional regulator of competence genes